MYHHLTNILSISSTETAGSELRNAVPLITAFPVAASSTEKCATIQGGTIKDVKDNVIPTGFDKWGYNYQATMFNGLAENVSREGIPVTTGVSLVMQWNDAFLSNKDCDGNQKLDRHFPYASYIGSGAWITNHWLLTSLDPVSGKTIHYTYFVKIVAVPAGATLESGPSVPI